MDFENVTDAPEPGLDFPASQDPFTKPEDTGPIPAMAAETPAATNTSTPAAAFGGDNKKMIYMLILSMFVTLTIGSVIAYVIISNINASEPKEDPYERYKKLAVPTKAATTAPEPSPTPEEATRSGAIQISEGSPEADLEEESSVDWRIVFDEPILSLASLDSDTIATLSATVFGPVEVGSYICLENQRNTHQYFMLRKSSQVFEKVCTERIDSKTARFNCMPYDPATGVIVDEALLPANQCDQPASTISKGTYVIYSKVHYNCDVEGKAEKSITESDCADTVDVTSEELTVTD